MKNVMVIYGTRPEAIKVAPLIKALERSDVLRPTVVVTGQHRSMLDQVNAFFDITPDVDLDLFDHGQSIGALGSRVLGSLEAVLVSARPDAVVVQGDTSTVAFAALSAFSHQLPVVHLEAGLRSGNIDSPFPEEGNRKVVGQLARLHLAPTISSAENLLREGVCQQDVTVTGNTVVDALQYTVGMEWRPDDDRLSDLERLAGKVLLLTTHRRENWGEPMQRIGRAIARIAAAHPEYTVVFPAHANPKVRASIVPHVEHLSNVLIIEPQDYVNFANLQRIADIVLTDSGGVQEEAPSLGKPVLVLRENTERPEAVDAGTVKLIGTDEDRIVAEVNRLIEDRGAYAEMAQAVNPYGDGRAAERSVAAIAELLGVGRRLPDFGSRALPI